MGEQLAKLMARPRGEVALVGSAILLAGIVLVMLPGMVFIGAIVIAAAAMVLIIASIIPPVYPPDATEISDMERCSTIGYFAFQWMVPMLTKANRVGKVEREDLPAPHSQDEPSLLYEGFLSTRVFGVGYPLQGPYGLIARLLFGSRSLMLIFLQRIVCMLLLKGVPLITPVLLQELLATSAEQPAGGDAGDGTSGGLLGLFPRGLGWFLALRVVDITGPTFAFMQQVFLNARAFSNAKAMISMAVYRCAFSGSPTVNVGAGQGDPDKAGGQTGGVAAASAPDVGKLTNMMNTDADTIASQVSEVHSLLRWFVMTASIPWIIYRMHALVGNAAWVGVAAMLLSNVMGFVQMFLWMKTFRQIQKARDGKSRVLTELIKGIKFVRLSGCEAQWMDKVDEAREFELGQVSREAWQATPTRELLPGNSYQGTLIRELLPGNSYQGTLIRLLLPGNSYQAAAAAASLLLGVLVLRPLLPASHACLSPS